MSEKNTNKTGIFWYHRPEELDYKENLKKLSQQNSLQSNSERDKKILRGISLIMFGASAPCVPLVLLLIFVTNLTELWSLEVITLVGSVAYFTCFWLSRNLKYVGVASWLLLSCLNLLMYSAAYFLGTTQPVPVLLVIPLLLSLFLLPKWATVLIGLLNLGFTYTIYLADYNPPLQINNALVNQILTILIWTIAFGATTGISFLLSLQFAQLKQANQLAIEQAQRLSDALHAAEHKRDFGHDVSEKLAAVTIELQTVASQQAGGSQEQVATLSQIISFLTEMLSNATNIEDRTEAIDQIVQRVLFVSRQVQLSVVEVKKSGQRGLLATEQTINTSQKVAELFGQLSEIINALKVRSEKIGDVIQLLKNLGNETHLLALNAAIEAAGVSGSSGGRFTVVAREIKRLADKSISSSREVEQILTEIENFIATASQLAEQSDLQTAQAVNVAYESGGVIGELISAIESNSQEVVSIEQAIALLATISSEISLATTQQRGATAQAVDSLRNLGSVAEQSASSSAQIKETSLSVEELSHELLLTLAN